MISGRFYTGKDLYPMNLKKMISGAVSAAISLSLLAGCGEISQETAGSTGTQTAAQSETNETASDTEVSETEAAAEKSETESVQVSEEETSMQEEKASTRIITDHTGAEVELPAEINRVVISSILPLPSVYCLFRGSAEDVVGIDPSSMAAAENSYLINVFPELKNADTSFAEGDDINVEELLALDPDVVFYRAEEPAEREIYENAGIPAVGFSTTIANFDAVETYAAWIQLLGEIYGEQDMANDIIAEGREVAAEISAVSSKIPEEEKPKVLILMTYSDTVMTASGNPHFGNYWITTAGGINVAAENAGAPEINMEQVYEWDPDIVILTNFSKYSPDDIYNNTVEGRDWATVSAVQKGQVYKFPLGMYRWFPPASDTPLSLQWLAKTIQPSYFGDIDIDSVIKDYYQRHYNVTLSDDDLQKIYNPSGKAAGN